MSESSASRPSRQSSRGGSKSFAKRGGGSGRGQKSSEARGGFGKSERRSDRGGKRSEGRGREESRREPRGGGRRENWGESRGKGSDRRRSRDDEPQKPDPTAGRGWGGVARKGARTMLNPEDATRRRRDEDSPEFEPIRVAKWERARDEEPAGAPKPKSGKGFSSSVGPVAVSDEATSEITKIVGKRDADRVLRYFREAAKAYAADRFADARRNLRVPLEFAAEAPGVKELNGMILYRLGKWQEAKKVLEAAHLLTQSFDLYPAMMDCARALGKHEELDAWWDELRRVSPSAEVIAEGRIVAAGSLADRERFADALRLLEKAPKPKGEPKEHHLRTMYVQADLQEKSGDLLTARRSFERLESISPGVYDVAHRLTSLQ